MKSSISNKRAAVVVALFAFGSLIVAGLAYQYHEAGPQNLTSKAPAQPDALEEPLEFVTASGVVHRLKIEVARSPEQQMLGLMYRTQLADDRGMLFPHDQPEEVQMWMRNTYIPLDMIFILPNGRIHRIEARTTPFSERVIASEGAVSGVLEMAGGAAERLGLKTGDLVRHPHFHDRAPAQ